MMPLRALGHTTHAPSLPGAVPLAAEALALCPGMQGLLASAALLPPRVRQARQPALRLAACRPCAALHAVPPPPRPPRAQPACSDVARRHSQLVCTVAAAPPAPPQPPPSLGSTIVVSLPAWLALALTAFMATFAGLCVLVIQTMLPALRDVSASAKSVQVACSGVVDACDEVEKLAVLLATDLKCVRRAQPFLVADISLRTGWRRRESASRCRR